MRKSLEYITIQNRVILQQVKYTRKIVRSDYKIVNDILENIYSLFLMFFILPILHSRQPLIVNLNFFAFHIFLRDWNQASLTTKGISSRATALYMLTTFLQNRRNKFKMTIKCFKCPSLLQNISIAHPVLILQAGVK